SSVAAITAWRSRTRGLASDMGVSVHREPTGRPSVPRLARGALERRARAAGAPTAVIARAEAVARLGGRYDARVLEPSPPAIAEPPWFADDPVGREQPQGALEVVSPVGGAAMRWDDVIASDAELSRWCADRWLGAYRAITP